MASKMDWKQKVKQGGTQDTEKESKSGANRGFHRSRPIVCLR